MPLILHVTEAHHGGIATSIARYVEATPAFDHALAYSTRRTTLSTPPDPTRFVVIRHLTGGHIGHIRQIRSIARNLAPDLVHAHSSYAGLYTRLLGLPGVVYSPHCYSFELDVPPLKGTVFRLVERALARRSVGTMAVSDHEVALASGLHSGQRVWLVPPAVAVPGRARPVKPPTPPFSIGSIGRVTPQKGIDFFIDVVRASDGLPARWTWIGGGNPELETRLSEAGVRVTGWVGPAQARQELERLDLYVHTANAEGAPVTFAEAAALGVPVIARDIPHLVGMPVAGRATTPEDLADVGRRLLAPGGMAVIAPALEEMRAFFSTANQEHLLNTAYEEAMDVRRMGSRGER